MRKYARLWSFLLDIIAVIIGVLMAFYINGRHETSQNNKKRVMALESMAAEMAENHQRLDLAFDYYHSVNRQLDSIKQHHPEEYNSLRIETNQIKGWRGVTPPAVRSHAYRMIIETGMAQHLYFNENHHLASVYNIQSMIEKFNDALVQKAMNDNEIYQMDYIHRYFKLYIELIPGVMQSYQKHGKEILKPYGYDLEIKSNVLKEALGG